MSNQTRIVIHPAVQAAETQALADHYRNRSLIQAQAIADLQAEIADLQAEIATLKPEQGDGERGAI